MYDTFSFEMSVEWALWILLLKRTDYKWFNWAFADATLDWWIPLVLGKYLPVSKPPSLSMYPGNLFSPLFKSWLLLPSLIILVDDQANCWHIKFGFARHDRCGLHKGLHFFFFFLISTISLLYHDHRDM